MEKERKIKTISVIALIVAILGLTVAFAVLSTTLTIKGNAKVESGKWDIRFENLSKAQITGKATTEGTAKINDSDKTKIQDINVTLIQPKDEVTYTANLVNDGTVDAEISNVKVPEFDEEEKKYAEFSAKYNDDNNEEIKVGDVLKSGVTKEITISIKFKEDATTLPESDLTVDLSYEINFVQSDGDEDDMQGDESQSKQEDLLRRYILGKDKTGRNLSEISDHNENISDIVFKNDGTMDEDISSKLEYIGKRFDAVTDSTVRFVYVKYDYDGDGDNKGKAYQITIKKDNDIWYTQSLEEVYEPKGREGQTIEFSYDGNEENKKKWTIIKDNGDTVEILSPDTLAKTEDEDGLTLGRYASVTSSDHSEETIKKVITVIDEYYNKAIEKINSYCKEIVTNKKVTINGKEYDVTDVRSVGAETDETTEKYTSEKIPEWAKEYEWLSKFNGIAKTGDTYYEDDFVRMLYWGVAKAGDNTDYWVASRAVTSSTRYTHQYSLSLRLFHPSKERELVDYMLCWFKGKDNQCSGPRERVRPVVSVLYPG